MKRFLEFFICLPDIEPSFFRKNLFTFAFGINSLPTKIFENFPALFISFDFTEAFKNLTCVHLFIEDKILEKSQSRKVEMKLYSFYGIDKIGTLELVHENYVHKIYMIFKNTLKSRVSQLCFAN